MSNIWGGYGGMDLSQNFEGLGNAMSTMGGGLLSGLQNSKVGGLLGDWMGKKFGNDPIRQESVEMDQNIDYSISPSEVDKGLASPDEDLFTGGESGQYENESGDMISYTSADPEGFLQGSTEGVSGYPDGSDDLYRHQTEEVTNPNQSIDTRYNQSYPDGSDDLYRNQSYPDGSDDLYQHTDQYGMTDEQWKEQELNNFWSNPNQSIDTRYNPQLWSK